MKTTTINLRKVVRNSFCLYFAPITGAVKAVRSELQRINAEHHKDDRQHA